MSRHHRLAHQSLGLALLAASLTIAGTARAAPPPGPAGPPPAAVSATLPIPQWVGATDARGRAQLTWIRSPAFASVRVYRREMETEPAFKLLGETRENSYLDATVAPGGAYRYRLAGVGPDGRVGRNSAELLVRIGTVTLRTPSPPEWEGYLPVEDGIGLKWSAREGEDVIAYNVYRKEPPETEARLVGSSRGTSYHDTGLEPGRLYVYTLTALDSGFRETAPSAELPVKFAPPQAAAGPRRPSPVWSVRRTRLVALVAGGGNLPFARPADVALGPVSGSVYVSDSGRNRVFVFSAQGVFQRMVGAGQGDSSAFKRLLGVATDRDENLYAVDAGTASIQVFTPLGRLSWRIDLPRPAGGGATGFIDAVPGPDGRIFAVDNFNNRVVVASREGEPLTFGQAGGKAGEFSAPTFCDTDAGGSFYVADCLNARVQVFSNSGEFVRAFGKAERGPGGFGRPKGVAVSAAGEIYVADSWLNTVQVFDREGRFVALLGDENGVPLDLGSPNGVALGPGGSVYIAERLAARLQIRELLEP